MAEKITSPQKGPSRLSPSDGRDADEGGGEIGDRLHLRRPGERADEGVGQRLLVGRIDLSRLDPLGEEAHDLGRRFQVMGDLAVQHVDGVEAAQPQEARAGVQPAHHEEGGRRHPEQRDQPRSEANRPGDAEAEAGLADLAVGLLGQQVADADIHQGRMWKDRGPGMRKGAARLANSQSSGRVSRGSMMFSTR